MIFRDMKALGYSVPRCIRYSLGAIKGLNTIEPIG